MKAPDFETLLEGFDREVLQSESKIILGLWPDYTMAGLNPGWHRFAEANGGQASISENWGIGSNALDAISPALRGFYQKAYGDCLNRCHPEGELFQHEYECSSKETFRRFHMTIYSLGERQGLLIAHSLVYESAHDPAERAPQVADESRCRHADGIIYQCMYCRKVRHLEENSRWDWIPDWVERSPRSTSHVICGLCRKHYFEKLGIPMSGHEHDG
jgi:hypothetical protein